LHYANSRGAPLAAAAILAVNFHKPNRRRFGNLNAEVRGEFRRWGPG